MRSRPFRFAIQAANAGSSREWHSLARQVEDLGYSTLFLADHYLGPGPAQRAAHTPRQDLAARRESLGINYVTVAAALAGT